MNEKEEEKETRYQTRIHGGRSRKRYTAGNAGDHNEKDKYEKLLKIGHCKSMEQNGFCNYFIAQKVRAKIMLEDEKLGNRELLSQK